MVKGLMSIFYIHKDGSNCYPYRVAESIEMGGRHMVATRDIEAGELILRETPLTVGNLHETPPVCLACWRIADGLYHCPQCSLPMCNEICANSSPHRYKQMKIWIVQL